MITRLGLAHIAQLTSLNRSSVNNSIGCNASSQHKPTIGRVSEGILASTAIGLILSSICLK